MLVCFQNTSRVSPKYNRAQEFLLVCSKNTSRVSQNTTERKNTCWLAPRIPLESPEIPSNARILACLLLEYCVISQNSSESKNYCVFAPRIPLESPPNTIVCKNSCLFAFRILCNLPPNTMECKNSRLFSLRIHLESSKILSSVRIITFCS